MKKILLLLLLFAPIFHIQSQTFIDNSVARVGNISISDKEFLERYELTPGTNRQRKSTIESQKIEFLFSLIAEKLWYLEAVDQGIEIVALGKELREISQREAAGVGVQHRLADQVCHRVKQEQCIECDGPQRNGSPDIKTELIIVFHKRRS